MSQEQIWIIKADGTPTFVYDFDMQEGDRLATPEEVVVLENGPVPALEEARAAALAALATRRWQAETAGIQVNGMDIPTDRESQGLITGAVAGTLIDPAQEVRWKTAMHGENGAPIFVTLTAQAIQIVALAVRAHVQLCFDCEAVKSAQVAGCVTAADVAAWRETELNQGWPESVYRS